LRSLNVAWLHNQIGLVSQKPVLFDTSIAENICYGANFRDVSDEEVEAPAKPANIHNFISSLPQVCMSSSPSTFVISCVTVMPTGVQYKCRSTWHTTVWRAETTYSNCSCFNKISLLDETTSALDTESKKVANVIMQSENALIIVQEALDSARKGRTNIVIAHRLSTTHNAYHIAVIKNGMAGTHSQLMEWKGAYYKLNQAQMLSQN